MDNGKTIKQIADELGVSKQAVQKRLSREPLKSLVYPYIEKVGGTCYIMYNAEILIKQAFKTKKHVQGDTSVDMDKIEYCTHPSIAVDIDVDHKISALKDKFDGDMQNLLLHVEQLSKNVDQLTEGLKIAQEHNKALTQELVDEIAENRSLTKQLATLADQAQKLQLMQIAADKEKQTDKKPGLIQRLFSRDGV